MEPCDFSQPPRLFGPGARLHPSHGLAYRRSRGLAHLRRFEARSPAGPSPPPRPALPATPREAASPAMPLRCPLPTELPVKETQRTQIGNGSRQRTQAFPNGQTAAWRFPRPLPTVRRPRPSTASQPKQHTAQTTTQASNRHWQGTPQPASSLSTGLSTSTQPPRS